jgi:hypothetical protein
MGKSPNMFAEINLILKVQRSVALFTIKKSADTVCTFDAVA